MKKIIARISVVLLSSLISANVLADILVPAYFYPSFDPNQSYWDEMTTAASKTNITAIMNPASGSGSTQNSDYVAAVNGFRAAGGQVIGYVATGYGARSQVDVLTEVANYQSFYNVDGIFLDEMSNQAGDLAYYQAIYNNIKGLNNAYKVFGNAGTNTLEAYLTAADVLVTFENQTGYEAYVPDTWTQNYSAERFAHLMYNVGTPSSMLSYIALAEQRNVGYVYVTDDNNSNPNSANNPWDTLPSYWEQEVSVKATPLPVSAWLLLSTIAFYGVWRKRITRI